jgi:hypothetical protein
MLMPSPSPHHDSGHDLGFSLGSGSWQDFSYIKTYKLENWFSLLWPHHTPGGHDFTNFYFALQQESAM